MLKYFLLAHMCRVQMLASREQVLLCGTVDVKFSTCKRMQVDVSALLGTCVHMCKLPCGLQLEACSLQLVYLKVRNFTLPCTCAWQALPTRVCLDVRCRTTDVMLCWRLQFAVSAVLSVVRGLLSRRQDDLDD